HPGTRVYTFWEYTPGARGRDWGLRIDHLLLNPAAAGQLDTAGVDRVVRTIGKSTASATAANGSELPVIALLRRLVVIRTDHQRASFSRAIDRHEGDERILRSRLDFWRCLRDHSPKRVSNGEADSRSIAR